MATIRLCLGERNVANLKLQNIVVVFDPPADTVETYKNHGKLCVGDEYLFLGEIKNMPGHGIFVSYKTGETLYGYHTENFYLLMEGIKVVETKTVDEEVLYTVEEQDYPEISDDDESL